MTLETCYENDDMETSKNRKSANIYPGLHLDEIQQEGGSSISFEYISSIKHSCEAIPPIKDKRHEHSRLVKEYIECCKSPDALFDLSLDEIEEGGTPRYTTDTREFYPFLPPASASVPVCHSPSNALNGSTLHGSASRRRDIPAAAATLPPATAKAASITVTFAMDGATGDTAANVRALVAEEAMVDAHERSVYRAQVATALGRGRRVWL
jgi:hypothetical protein